MIELYHDLSNGGNFTVIDDEGNELNTDTDQVEQALRDYWNRYPPDDPDTPETVKISPSTIMDQYI